MEMYLVLFFTYVMAGLAIARPVGAITVEMTKQGLKNGFMHGRLSDWEERPLITVLYFGLAPILQLPFTPLPLWIIAAEFLFFIGLDSIKNADQDITLSGEKPKKSLWSSYRNGFLVAVSPGNIVFWLNVFGSILTSSYSESQPIQFIIVAAGILTVILIHDIGLLSIVTITRKVMSRGMIKWFSIIAAIILISFSGYFVYEFIISLKHYI